MVSTRKMTLVAMMAALTAVVTRIVQVPMPMTQGYINLGDVFIIFSAFYLGPAAGAFIGGVGSAIADVMTGYQFYYFTFVIKGLEGAAAGLPAFRFDPARDRRSNLVRLALGGITGAVIMVIGYFSFHVFFYNPVKAVGSLLGNVLQGAFGVAGAFALVSRGLGKFMEERRSV